MQGAQHEELNSLEKANIIMNLMNLMNICKSQGIGGKAFTSIPYELKHSWIARCRSGGALNLLLKRVKGSYTYR